ncbi:MAG: hypothetical protein K6E54_08910 [Bacteroidaceae bacterium]|nr:hypothetical protein [Bacteroidaceae bacterium]
MKQISIILSVILCLTACSEDKIEANYKDVTVPFIPATDDNSTEAEMRRSFFAEHGSYLLFNDTLQHIELGRDVNGNMQYFTELLDITYEVGSTSTTNNKFSFSIISTDENKKIAIDYLENYILPHISGKLKPFSWFLANKITRDYIGKISTPYAVAGQRAIIIATYLLPKLSDAQKIQYTRQIMNTIIGKLATDNAAAFDAFTTISSQYYNQKFTTPESDAENADILANAGFICKGQDELKTDQNGYYPSQYLDIQAYARLITANTMDVIKTKYAEYPLILQKSEIAYNILTSLGYKE